MYGSSGLGEDANAGGDDGTASAPRPGDQPPLDQPPQPPPQNKGWPSKRLPPDARYFIMKSFSMRDISISLKKGIWATQHRNESKLNQAFNVRRPPASRTQICKAATQPVCLSNTKRSTITKTVCFGGTKTPLRGNEHR